MSLRLPALAMVALVAFSGCIGDSAENDADGTRSDASRPDAHEGMERHAVAPISYGSCLEYGTVTPVPAVQLEPYMPEGFAPVTVDPAGALGVIVVVAFECVEGRIGHHEADRVAEMWGLVPVVPPPEYTSDGIAGYSLALGAFTSHPGVAHLYTHWGLNETIYLGNVSVGLLGTPGSRTGEATGADADFRVQVHAAAAGMAVRDDGGRGRIFFAPEGKVTGALDFHYSAYTYLDGFGPGAATFAVRDGLPVWLPLHADPGVGFHDWGWSYELRFVPAEHLGKPKHGHDGNTTSEDLSSLRGAGKAILHLRA